jgi:hypothetical protein
MKFFWLSFFSAVFILMFFFTSCDGPIIGGECSDVEPTLHQTLSSVQKESGHFSKGDLYHYKHSYGFNFDLKVTKDTLFWQDIIDICHFGDEQIRSVKLESTYPIVSVNMTFHDDYLSIHYKGNEFWTYYDSTGFHKEYDDYLDLLDSVTIGNVKYIDVYKFNALGTGASIYYSEKNGILKIYENDSTYFEIIGEDNE